MPQVEGAPKELNNILETAYNNALKEYKGDKKKASQVAWAAVKNVFEQDKDGKWVKKKKEMSEEITIDAFKAGDYPQGKFGAKELSEIQSTYDPDTYEAPILIGHLSDPSYQGKSTIPAYGWIGKVKVVGDHLKLVASQFSEQLKQFIKEGFYKKVSAAFFQPDDPNNPTPGKWHLHHLAFLGGTPPAVKGLEQIAFAEMVKGLGVEFAEMDTQVESEPLDVAEEMGTEDTLSDLAEACANCMKKIEDALSSDADYETQKSRCQLALSDCTNEMYSAMNMHWMFVEKLENVEEHNEAEMSEKKNWLVELYERITKRKDQDMDAKKEKEYQDEIGTLKAKVTAFEEEKTKAEEEKAKAAEEAKDNTLKSKIATFCDQAIKDGKMTVAMRADVKDDKGNITKKGDETVMFELGKISAESLKSFQEKYTVQVVPTGVTSGLDPKNEPEKKTDIFSKAKEYAAAHKSDKEFAGLNAEDAVSRAIWLNKMDRIKL